MRRAARPTRCMAGRWSTATRRRPTWITSPATTACPGRCRDLLGSIRRIMSRCALVIGGSLGGLLAANLLRRAGWDAAVFERNEEDLTGRGVGLGTHPQLTAVLRRAGIAFDETMGIKVPRVVCLDRTGKIMIEQPSARTMTSWSRLYRALRSTLPARDYRLGKKLRRIEQDADGVSATFEDDSRERGDLLVG